MSSHEQNKAAVRACFESASQGNFDALNEIVAQDYVLHPEEVHGAKGLMEMVEGYRNALSGLRVTIDQQFSEGDYVATRFTIRGTHDGDLMGAPPTGNDVAFTGITISRCDAGRIVEEWEITDTLSLLGQVGALPAMAQS
jgi:predicted ester cyclase